MLKIEKLQKSFGTRRALSSVTLEFPRGEIVGLFGENGAGKSTLMKCILGIHRAIGSVTLDGEPIDRDNIDRLSFATSEHSFFPNLSIEAHRDFYREHFPRFNDRRFNALSDFFGIARHTPVGRLSTGQKNQVELVLALSQGADYILLDEPFSGSDIFNREDFYKLLSGILEPNETVILSTHLIEEVSGFVGRAILIRGGEIVGDIDVSELEESGETLVDAVKKSYGYRPDRAARAISEILGEEDGK